VSIIVNPSLPKPVRLYRPKGPERVALVVAEPVPDRPGMAALWVSRGPRVDALKAADAHGPFPVEEAAGRVNEAVQALRADGFWPSGLHALLTALQDSRSAVRARAAARLGWRRDRDAVDDLLAVLPNAGDDTCAILDALGAIGDPKAVPVVRPYAERKLLSRRRSAVEALRNLGDTDGLAQARQRNLDQLPVGVQIALAGIDENKTDPATFEQLVKAVQAAEAKLRGLIMDSLYELATPATVGAVLVLLRAVKFDQPFVWRYVKSIFKRAMLRHDPMTFGLSAHDIESQGRNTVGTTASVKSGYDGAQRSVRVFGRKTQNFLRGLSWRYLRDLARYRPGLYPYHAAEAVIHYSPEDAEQASGLYGVYASCYVMQKVVYGRSQRLKFNSRTWRTRFVSVKHQTPPTDAREESFPDLWEAQPRAYLRVLGWAKLPEVHRFAARAVSRDHRDVLHAAPLDEVVPLLNAPYEPTVQLGLQELERRFDPKNPDWALLERLLKDEREPARILGRNWLRQTAPLWANDPARALAFLELPDGVSRAIAADLLIAHLGADPQVRRTLADGVLARLRAAEPSEGAHEALSRVAREALADELNARLTVADLAKMVSHGSPAAQAMAGALLGRRPEALAELGLERVAELAGHEIAAVRAAAHQLIRAAHDRLRESHALLFTLVESEWEDTRHFAMEMLRKVVPWGEEGLDGFVGLLDSNRVEVQDLGRDLVRQYFPRLPVAELIGRITEHPHPNVRRFALELVVGHLPPGAEPLSRLSQFFRSALFDVWPERRVKRQVIDFLAKRGLEDEGQAAVAAGLLGEFVRLQSRGDFERALEALARIRLAFPKADNPLTLRAEALA
jgi:hypothetical protein